ncbi:MAG: amidohydrolase family protein [Candidatus Hermodarchaeota archaeon]
MEIKQVFSRFALIGDNLDLKENVILGISADGKIVNISYNNESPEINTSKNNNNRIIIPGFINSHVHIGDSFAKESGFNKDLVEIVAPPKGLKHILLDSTPKDLKIKGIKNAALEMISNGITCFIDFRERGLEGIKILNEALSDFALKYKILGRFNDPEEINSIFKSGNGLGLSSYKIVKNHIRDKLKEEKLRYKKLIACHVGELERDERILKRIVEDKLVDVIIHGTQFKKKDVMLIKKANIALVLCPRSNAYFGAGFPPINEILDLEIPVSLGTDNVMTNNTDIFEEMRFLYRISRVLNKSGKLGAKTLLKMVTINAAKNFKIESSIGSIKKGKEADFFIIDLNAPNFYLNEINNRNILPLIVQRTKSENIKEVYIKGIKVHETK